MYKARCKITRRDSHQLMLSVCRKHCLQISKLNGNPVKRAKSQGALDLDLPDRNTGYLMQSCTPLERDTPL